MKPSLLHKNPEKYTIGNKALLPNLSQTLANTVLSYRRQVYFFFLFKLLSYRIFFIIFTFPMKLFSSSKCKNSLLFFYLPHIKVINTFFCNCIRICMILPDLESRSGKKQGYGSESTKKIILGYLCLEVKFAVFKLSKLNFTIFVKKPKKLFSF